MGDGGCESQVIAVWITHGVFPESPRHIGDIGYDLRAVLFMLGIKGVDIMDTEPMCMPFYPGCRGWITLEKHLYSISLYAGKARFRLSVLPSHFKTEHIAIKIRG